MGGRFTSAWRSASKLLRKPALVVGEVVAIAATIAVAATVPQSDGASLASSAERAPGAAGALGLDRILASGWFLALVALAMLSLVAVQIEQWKRLRRTWGAPVDPGAFARAPYRRELPLPAGRAAPAPRYRRSGRAGLLGSPVFHLGLLVIAVAGLARLLFFRDAGVHVVEGDTVLPSPAAWEVQRGGPLSQPFALPAPLRVDEVLPSRYASGALKQVSAKVALEGAGGARELAINAPLDMGGGRSLYILQGHGPAALFERRGPAGGAPVAVYLDQRGDDWRGRLQLGDGREVRLRAPLRPERPDRVEARVLEGPVLRAIAELSPGSELTLGGGETLRLVALPWWAELWGSRDASRPLFFAGAVLAIGGIVLLFGFVPVDSAVFVQGDRVVVALRPQRFAPLFAERFEQACKEWQS